MEKLRWGILGTGRIAGLFARGVRASEKGRLAAVGSRAQATAEAFASEHGVGRTHNSYQALIEDSSVQAVYVGTPHPTHADLAIRAVEAGKHVLCEKPLTMNLEEARRVAAAARAHGVLLMEAFMYRCHPQTAKIVELVKGGVLGRIGLVQATFSFRRDFVPSQRLWSKKLGGGGILDVGCYPVSLARLVAGAASGKPFVDPAAVNGAGEFHLESGVDTVAAATLQFPGGLIAQVSCGIALQQDSAARIYGTEGWLHVPSPFVLPFDGGKSSLWLHRKGAAPPEEIVVEAGPLYGIEADAFASAAEAGLKDVPAMSVDDSLGNMAALDRWRAAIGLTYPGEREEGAGQ